MRKFILQILIIFPLVTIGMASDATAQKRVRSSLLRQQLNELNQKFTYRGKAIHPRAIKDLVSWIGGAPFPGTTALAVAGTFESDRYFGDYETQKERTVFIDLAQKYLEEEGWFAYRYLGRLANGYHVLQTSESGGGTGVFGYLLLIEAAIDFEYGDHGELRPLLVLKRRGEFNLGDGYLGKVKILPKENTILIGADVNSDGRPPDDLVKASRIKIPSLRKQ
jgi:hypothetical protein